MIPEYWQGAVEDVVRLAKSAKKAVVRTLCKTAGGHDVIMFEYGKKNNLNRTANYSSALGARDVRCYADKTALTYTPCVFLIGAEHGAEFEGTVAINNLISLLETGRDLGGKAHPELLSLAESINLLLIPCLNVDGRLRVPLRSMVGQDFEKFRFYAQGTWKDGSLCMYPKCKTVHPIKDSAGFLGGYFNDNGVNIVHDNFFFPMAEETKALLKVADDYVPDISVHLHGGANCMQTIFEFAYVPEHIRQSIIEISRLMARASEKKGLGHQFKSLPDSAGIALGNPPPSFNIQSAFVNINGEISFIYESNQGLNLEKGISGWNNAFTYDEIYAHHLILFEEVFKYAAVLKTKRLH